MTVSLQPHPDFGISFEQNETKKNLPSTSAFMFNPSISQLFPLDTHVSYMEVSQVPHDALEAEEEKTMMARRRHIIIKESSVSSFYERLIQKKNWARSPLISSRRSFSTPKKST
jgi:hypothetical protein